MIISDLNYLEEVVAEESHDVEGGILNIGSFQSNNSNIRQTATATSGNGILSALNVAAAVNAAIVTQANA